jgi:membrane protein implicated in regulation of membrane protease activity
MPSTDRDGRPSALLWFIAAISVLLPIAGVAMAAYGGFRIFAGAPLGWAWLAVGVLLLVADLVIDHRWSYWFKPAESDLNRRGDQLVGQVVMVVEAILPGGRGAVRAGDTVWVAEGGAAEAGARVRITGCKNTVLSVERV